MTQSKALFVCTLLFPSLVAATDKNTRIFFDKDPKSGIERYIFDQGSTSSRYDFRIVHTVKDGRDLTGRLGSIAHLKDRLEDAASHGNRRTHVCKGESVTIDETRTAAEPMLKGKTLTIRRS